MRMLFPTMNKNKHIFPKILKVPLQSYTFSVCQPQPLVQFLTSLSLLLRLNFFISNGNNVLIAGGGGWRWTR